MIFHIHGAPVEFSKLRVRHFDPFFYISEKCEKNARVATVCDTISAFQN